MSDSSTPQTHTAITVNGRTYHSAEEMPPEDRQAYERLMEMLVDQDGNGVPDILEGKGEVGPNIASTSVQLTGSLLLSKDGKCTRWEDLPEAERKAIEAAGGGPDQLARQLADQGGGAFKLLSVARKGSLGNWPSSSDPPGGITIRLSWGTLVKIVLILAAAAATVVWFRRASGKN